jgi:heme/copper-type cytochrome/quinol oxidase subunit 1
MPRRIYTYPASMGWGPLNLLASAGAVFMATGVLLFLIDVVRALRAGMTYANVHDATFPSGEIRAQINNKDQRQPDEP